MVTAKNALRFRNLKSVYFKVPTKPVVLSSSSSFSSSLDVPAILAALATKYGGSSPIAVPKPHKKASIATAL